MTAAPIVLMLAYPVLVYFALQSMQPRSAALCVFALLLLRLAIIKPQRLLSYAHALTLPGLLVAGAMLTAMAFDDPIALRVAPALVNFALLISFARSLSLSQSMIERFARIQTPSLDHEEVLYCQRMTLVWCAFFLSNSVVILWLALVGTLMEWAAYTGFISYVLVGILYGSEFIYRHWRFRRYVGAPTDFVLRRIFPPRPPEWKREPEAKFDDGQESFRRAHTGE